MWNSNFYPVFLFGIDNYLEGDIKNVIYSLLRIALFIKQYSLENKKAQIIPQITDFGYIAWKFLLAIYQSSWDKFIANKDNKTFRQCIFT